jgi:hypothetical protein
MDPVTSTRLIPDAVNAFETLSDLCNVSGTSPATPFELTTEADEDEILESTRRQSCS